MSERAARTVLGLVIGALLASVLSVDLPRLSGQAFWGDGATYYGMAWSLAEDGDIRYETKDLIRVKREFPEGPQGVFLKRASGGLAVAPEAGFPWLQRVPAHHPRTYFAKPFAYPLAAAPFVRLFGTRGLLLTNALALGLCLALGYRELRRRQAGPGAALAASLVLFLGGVAPVYLVWPAPELFNMALVVAGLVAWSSGRPIWSAVLLALASYSKPYNLWLTLPLGLEPLLESGWPWPLRLRESVRRGLVYALAVGALFGANAAVTGEANYQGGAERKTFYGRFPGAVEVVDGIPREVTFGNAGQWMSTNQAGPRYEGREAVAPGAEPPRSASELRQSFVRNLGYFWVGRFGGALAYFFPVLLAGALLIVGPLERRGWLALATLLVSAVFYVVMIPDNWYGGSGTIGNRYFLNLVPLGLYLVPRGRVGALALGGLAGAAFFVSPILLAPMQHSLHPGAHTLRWPFRQLPLELSMLNDLSVFTETWRKKQPVGDTEGDRWRNWPAEPTAYYLYFPDDVSGGKQDGPGGEGFRLRPGASGEVLLRALEPVRRMTLLLTAGDSAGAVDVAMGGSHASVRLSAGASGEAVLQPGPGFPYKDSFVYVLRFRSPPAGAFVRIALEVDKRRR